MNREEEYGKRLEQEQENYLIIALEAFCDFCSYATIDSRFAIPGEADIIRDKLMELYEDMYQ